MGNYNWKQSNNIRKRNFLVSLLAIYYMLGISYANADENEIYEIGINTNRTYTVSAHGWSGRNLFGILCSGYRGRSPSLVLSIKNQFNSISLAVQDHDAATIIVIDPVGSIYCASDSGRASGGSLVLDTGLVGNYLVYVGINDQARDESALIELIADFPQASLDEIGLNSIDNEAAPLQNENLQLENPDSEYYEVNFEGDAIELENVIEENIEESICEQIVSAYVANTENGESLDISFVDGKHSEYYGITVCGVLEGWNEGVIVAVDGQLDSVRYIPSLAFDSISGDGPTETLTRLESFAPGWDFSVEIDPLTDQITLHAYRASNDRVGGAYGVWYRPDLTLACYENRTQFYIREPDAYLGSIGRPRVTYRINSEQAVSSLWR